jgi:hypothetical protein
MELTLFSGATIEWPPIHSHPIADSPISTCWRCIVNGQAPGLYQTLLDLLTEHDRFGGVPNSSPAWGPARDALAAVRRHA